MRWELGEVALPAHLCTSRLDLLAGNLDELIGGIRRDRVVAVTSPTAGLALFDRAGLDEVVGHELVVREAVIRTADDLANLIASRRAEVVIGIGGGKALDVAKYAAAATGTILVVVPTIVSHDGLASPVAVLRGTNGLTDSLPAATPFAVMVPIDVVQRAPTWSPFAALGDVLGNSVAIEDWRAAAAGGGERVNDYALLLSDQAWKSAHRLLEAPDLVSRFWWEDVVQSTMMSSLSMCIAGSSRPASGGEHLVSHALDAMGLARRPHGLQVAFGTLTCLALAGDQRFYEFSRLWMRAGIDMRPSAFGLDAERFAEVVRLAPSTRPDRPTRLDGLADDDCKLVFAALAEQSEPVEKLAFA